MNIDEITRKADKAARVGAYDAQINAVRFVRDAFWGIELHYYLALMDLRLGHRIMDEKP